MKIILSSVYNCFWFSPWYDTYMNIDRFLIRLHLISNSHDIPSTFVFKKKIGRRGLVAISIEGGDGLLKIFVILHWT